MTITAKAWALQYRRSEDMNSTLKKQRPSFVSPRNGYDIAHVTNDAEVAITARYSLNSDEAHALARWLQELFPLEEC